MRTKYTSVVGRIAAVLASAATTLALLLAVVSLSEPQRSQLVAATADRQMVNKKSGGFNDGESGVALATSAQGASRALR